MGHVKGQLLFFDVPYWEWATTGEVTLEEIAKHKESCSPTGCTRYARYCPSCGSSWKGKYLEDLTCCGCGQMIKEVKVDDLLPNILGHLRYLNHE